MTTYRRVGRWALIVAAVLVAGWVLLRVGVGVYLRTPAGRAVVAHQLQEAIGLPVEVSEVDLGARSSLKFRVLETATGPIPQIMVESARVHIRQQGQPDFDVSGINVKAEPKGQKLTLSGTIDDPHW